MPTKRDKQYATVAKVARAVEQHGTSVRPEIRELSPDWRSWNKQRYGLGLIDASGKDVLRGQNVHGFGIEVLNQCLGAVSSTVRKQTRKK